jgi:hypothetical protein
MRRSENQKVGGFKTCQLSYLLTFLISFFQNIYVYPWFPLSTYLFPIFGFKFFKQVGGKSPGV